MQVSPSFRTELEQALLIANTQTTGEFIFAGGDVLNRPYDETRDGDGLITSVDYLGTTAASDDIAAVQALSPQLDSFDDGLIGAVGEFGALLNRLEIDAKINSSRFQ